MIRRFFSYYRPYRGLFILDFGFAVLSGLMELGFPVAVQIFVDRLLPGHNWMLISIAALILLGVYFINTGLMTVVTYWGHRLGINIETDMRREAFAHVQKLSFAFFDNNKTGHLVGRLTKDLEDIGEIAHHGPEDVFLALMTFVGAFVLMAVTNLELALLTALVAPLIIWVITHFGQRMTVNAEKIFRRVKGFNTRIEENVGGMRVVQAFANEDHEQALFEADNHSYRETKLEGYWYMAAGLSLSYMGMRLVQMLVMVAGAWFVIRGELTEGGFISFLLLVNVFMRPVDKINAMIELYPRGLAGFKSFTELIDTEPDIADRADAKPVEMVLGDIVFDNVGFRYAVNGRPALKEICLSVRAGETIAFVGPSGAGKTTICSLLPRFYEVTDGAILIDGTDVRDITLASLRSHIGVVQQDVFLFGGTVRENIAYGKLNASDAEIAEAARHARLDEVIEALPQGMETVIGERGVKLSGGQKQRLSIARMFLKNPPILILDEATSALDTATERAIQASLDQLAKGRTTLVIAHRLATIQNADRIAVVEGGRIIETGTHDDLLKESGAYARLHAAQFSGA
ncbi:ABC transporter ATP-binding protein [Martelella mediterranea]|uniref:ATP-binding cassette subfamily B protein n=1 Tax=Martelella mediterranea TaxID=293089 RepID=A0A4R3NUC9_9HYPH|nr:ABC transporter ATP-binding protein [Martelella mediterranea]TCT40908.1 ATP-binding cassette subfamily B protein [Martelella mediterranea]